MKQKTIVNQISARGKGRNSDGVVNIKLLPAPENTGIVFRVKSSSATIDIPAIAEFASIEREGLLLQKNGCKLHGTEHFLATCYGMEIHNIIVEVSGNELPRMTDSAAGFLFLLRSAGFREQNAQRPGLSMGDPVLIRNKQGWVRLNSFKGLRIGCVNTLSETSASVHRSSAVVDISPAIFASELCHAQDYADVDFSGAEFSKSAEKNMQVVAQRSQLNHMVVKIMSMLALTNMYIDGCYTAFDADMETHLQVINDLVAQCVESERQMTGGLGGI